MLRKTLDYLPLARPYLVVVLVSIVLFWPTWFRLARAWLQFEQVLVHGLPTFLIFIGLLFVHPPQPVTRKTSDFSWLGGAFLICSVIVWSLLELVRIDTLAFLILPVGMVAISWALLGLPKTLSFLPYVVLLSLSLPFWADIVPLLVSLASVVVGEWVRWFGITALIEGNSITLPYGRLIIADGCSGIRYFAISILLAMMTSILNDFRWKSWLVTVMTAMLIGLLANWVRITILVFVAHETNMESDLLTDHETLGWIVFSAFILPALYFSPVRKRNHTSNASITRESNTSKAGVLAIVVAIIIGPIALTLAQLNYDQNAPWDLKLENFQAHESGAQLPMPISLPSLLDQKIWNSGQAWISLAQSQRSEPNKKLVPYLTDIYENSTWQLEEHLAPGALVYRNILTRDVVLMAQWYQVGNRSSLKYREAKLLQIPATLSGESRFALVTIQVRCGKRHCDNELSLLQRTKALVETQL